jgi:hypothetical protein
MAQFLRPASDVSDGPWVPSTGANLYATIDESSADDNDYIYTTEEGVCEVALSSATDPAVNTGHTVRYRAAGNGVDTLHVELWDNSGTPAKIAEWDEAAASATITGYSHNLSGGEADAIADYADLSLKFELAAGGTTYYTISLVNTWDMFADYATGGTHAFTAASAGNLLVAWVVSVDPSTANTAGTPSGFTSQLSVATGSALLIGGSYYGRVQCFTKVAAGGENSITWTGSGGEACIAAVAEFSKAGGTWSLDGTPGGNSGTGANTWGPPNITLTGDKSAIAAFTCGLYVSDVTPSPFDTAQVDDTSVFNASATHNIYSTAGTKTLTGMFDNVVETTDWIAGAIGIKASS